MEYDKWVPLEESRARWKVALIYKSKEDLIIYYQQPKGQTKIHEIPLANATYQYLELHFPWLFATK